MKAGNKDPIAQNFAVLASLTDICRQLTDRCALVGRLGSKVVIDTSQAPALFLDELESIFHGCALTSETGDGSMRVFSRLTADSQSETLLLDANTLLRQGFDDFMEFPALREIHGLIEAIPPLPQELAAHYAAISNACAAAVHELLQKSGDEILQAVFAGADDDTSQADDVPKRTLN